MDVSLRIGQPMPPRLLLLMLLIGCSCQLESIDIDEPSPATEPESLRPLFLVMKSYIAVMILLVFAIIILFMLQGSLVKIFGTISRCCRQVASVRERLVRKDDDEEDEGTKETEEINGNQFVTQNRPRKQSSLRMIDDVTPRLSFSDRQPDNYQSCAPAQPLPTFARAAEANDLEFSAALIQSIRNRHVESTMV